MSNSFAINSQSDHWQSPAAYFVSFMLIALLSEVVNVFLSLSFLKNGATEEVVLIYGIVNGFVVASSALMSFAFVAKQHVEKQTWKPGSLVFLMCLMASVALSVLSMQDALVYKTLNWPTSFLILTLSICGLIALHFLSQKVSSLQLVDDDLCDSEAKLNDL